MKYYFKIIAFVFVISLLFSACSSKKNRPDNSATVNKFYKNTYNSQIKNSKNMHKATMRPYNVFGKNYYPFVAKIGDEFKGIASWYGPNFHANKTSNGEVYNMYDLTAAHKTLPMNSVVRVDNLENGKSVTVRVNDRGPFVSGRIIDLSNAAAHTIDMVRKGTARVRLTLLGYNGEIANAKAPKSHVASKQVVQNKNYTIGNRVISDGFSIQLGAFSKSEGAYRTKNKYQSLFPQKTVNIKKSFSNGRYLFKVFIEGFKSKDDALDFKNMNGLFNSVVVNN